MTHAPSIAATLRRASRPAGLLRADVVADAGSRRRQVIARPDLARLGLLSRP